jgi:succinate-acetate transporter protein
MSAPDGAVRVVLRPTATPLPLGFLALAGATVLVAGLQLGWLAPAQGADVALVLIAFVAPLQLVACVFGLLDRDVAAGTGMGVLAGTWLAVGLVLRSSPPGATSDALGLFLLVAGAAMLIPGAAAATGKLVAAAVLGTTAVRFALTGVAQLTGSDAWADVAGITGLALGALALYAALALALEDARRTTTLPVGRRGSGKAALDGDLHDQVARAAREPGVRGSL